MIKLGVKIVLLFSLLLSLAGYSKGEVSKYIYEKDLSQYFYYYDLLDHTLLPELAEGDMQHVRSLLLSEQEISGKQIKFQFPERIHFFLNGRLVGEYTPNEEVLLDARDLMLKKDIVHVFSFYSKKGWSVDQSVWLVDESRDVVHKNKVEYNVGKRRRLENNYTGIYVVLLLALIIMAYLRFIHSSYLMSYFDITRYVLRAGTEDFIILNPFTRHSVLIIFLMSLFYTIAFINYDVVLVSFFKGVGVVDIFSTGLLVMLMVLIKYLYLVLINFIFGGKKVNKVHYFEFVRFFCLFGFVFLVFSIRNLPSLNYLLLGLYFIWLVWLLIVMLRKSNYRKMYLISYLCISEIVPIFILMKQLGSW